MPFQTYIAALPAERQEPIQTIIQLLETHLPKGFQAVEQYSMPSFVVPHQLFPAGYHCNPKEPLPFISIASQKNFIALYHMGLYASPELYHWFISEYPKYSKYKLDMGKSCIRFKRVDDIPYALLATLFEKMTCQDWIQLYSDNYLKKSK